MRPRTFLTLFIGMISLAMLATTPTLEQKQNIQFVICQESPPIEAVVNLDVTILQVAIFTENNYSHTFISKDNPKPNDLAIIDDVGWCYKNETKNIPTNRANLKYSYLPDIEKEMQKLGLKQSRDNC